MPQVIIPSDVPSLDGSLRSQAYAFLDKLRRDDTIPGLHIEPIEQAADKRVRTGRVNQFWRAVLIKLTGADTESRYVYLGTFPHDDAIAYAKNVVFRRNPRTSFAEVIQVGVADVVPPAGSPERTQPPAADDAPSVPVLQARGITFEDLVGLGLPSALADQALWAIDQDYLLEVALSAPSAFQTDALLLLGDGRSIEQVREAYRVQPVEDGTEQDSDDDLIDALDHPASRLEFTYLEDDDDLRTAIEHEDFARWRVFLHPEQQQHAVAHTRGAFRLSGAAGTGKTVVLLHRARHLHRQDPQARIVLTTFNKTLAASLRTNLLLLDRDVRLAKHAGEPGIFVGTVDAISWRLLSRATDAGLDLARATADVLGRPRTDVLQPTQTSVWDAALRDTGWDLPSALRNAEFFATEYGNVVLPSRITTRDDYVRARRQGRGVALGRAQRNAVWDVIDAYRAKAADGGTTDYDEKAVIAAAALDAAHGSGTRRVVDHVLVDEAQDLNPVRLVLLRALVATRPDDLFLAEDSQQRIYAPRTVLARHGIQVTGRSRRLLLNYRTTAQTFGYATRILGGQEVMDLEAGVVDDAGLRSARSGPQPVIAGCSSLQEAYTATIGTLKEWLADGTPPETIAVLVRTGNEGTALARALTRDGVPNQYYGPSDTPGAGRVVVMTMHRSKGMEFRDVILFGVRADSTNGVERFPEGDRPEALQRERSLLYVAATRARDRLSVVWDGTPSELLPVLEPGKATVGPSTGPAPRVAPLPAASAYAVTSKADLEALAREVHDTVGHSLAQIALQTSVLEVEARTNPAVREAAAFIRAATRRAGTELRGILTTLRSGAEGLAAVSFTDLTALLAGLQDQGARITSAVLVTSGDTADPMLTRACYRIVQESVTNALKHAAGQPIDIILRGAPESGITLVVQNFMPDGYRAAPTTGTTGSGLSGMSRRAVDVGGQLSAGLIAGRFVVDARLPWSIGTAARRIASDS